MASPLFILAGTRTPFCRMGTELAELSAADLGQRACAALLTRTGIDPAQIDEVIFGCVGQPVDAANVARVIALRAGVPQSVPAATVHRNCASGMEAVTTAAERLASGRGELFLVGGAESMSQVPLLFPATAADKFAGLAKARTRWRKLQALAQFRPQDLSPRVGLTLGLTDPYTGLIMGKTAEILAREFAIGREDQDAFAAHSHAKALAAREALSAEITPLAVAGKAVAADNGPRADSTPEKLATLKTIFERDTGTVTAGNSSQVTDGAAALLVGSETAAKRLGLEPLGRLSDYAYAGCDPERMGLGPVHALARTHARNGLTPAEADLVELNEAFAAQALAVLKAWENPKSCGLDLPAHAVDPAKLNRRGGAIALGHPVGATGARLILTALDQLRETRGKRALATLCVGGGQGAALWLERE